jgi:hypothetical protein
MGSNSRDAIAIASIADQSATVKHATDGNPPFPMGWVEYPKDMGRGIEKIKTPAWNPGVKGNTHRPETPAGTAIKRP